MKKIIASAKFRKIAWIAAALLLVYTLAGFMIVPSWLERAVPDYAEKYLGKPARVGDVHINPYLFTLEISGFQLDDAPDVSLLKLGRLYVDFELSSIFRRAWTFADIRMEGLDLSLVIDRERRLNIMALIERLKERKEPEDQERADRPSSSPPSVILERVSLSDGSVRFSDLSDEVPASTALSPINLTLTGFSTVPDQKGQYLLEAQIPGGGALIWEGDITLLPLTSNGRVSLRELKLADISRFFRGKLHMAEPGGMLSLSTNYGFSYGEGKAALGLTGAEAELSDFSVAPVGGTDGPPWAALRSVHLRDARVFLNDREIVIPALSLSNGTVSASMGEDGKLNWHSLLRPARNARDSGTKEAPENENLPWRVRIENLGLEKIGLAYTDHTLSPPLDFRIGSLDSHFRLDLTSDAEAARAAAKNMKLSIGKISIAPVFDSAAPLATLDTLSMNGGDLDTATRTVTFQNVALSGGGLSMARGVEGPVGMLRLLMPPVMESAAESKEGLQPPDNPGTAPAGAAKPAWKYRIGELELKQFKTRLVDATYTPAVGYDVNTVSLGLENIDSASEAPVTFSGELRVNDMGIIRSSGTIQQDFRQAKVRLDATGVPLTPLRPVVARLAAADLVSGHLAASTEINYTAGAAPEMMVAGSAGIQDFRLNEAATGDRLIAWKTLLAQKINLSIAPNQLSIKEIHVHEPGLKLAIDKERNVNLNQVLKHRPVEKKAPERQPPEPSGKDARDAPFRVRIAQVRVEQGTLDFSDMSLVLPFSTRVQELEGSVAGISTAPRSRADIQLSGQVEDYGEANAAGTLLTSDPKKFLDIEANFENIRMQPLSPYSATFAGRKIDAGKLWLTLHYKIVNGSLLGENRVELADFKLGERVEAPGALDLPLDLAVALLKGPNDRIKLAVPVRGDVGNPSFDYGKVVRAALANVIRRIVTSPFRLLGDLAGGQDAEQLRKVEFEPGSDEIEPSQHELLDSLAQVMRQRPGIRLTVRGPYDTRRDGENLRRRHVHRDLLAATGGMIEEGEDLGLIGYGDADTQKALEQLLGERSGGDAVRQFADAYKTRTGQEPVRVNPVLGLFGRGSRDREFYRAMFDHLVELQPLSEGELEALAASRAHAISDALRKAGVDSRNIIVGDIEAVTGNAGGEEDTVAGELSLSVAPAED